MKGVIRNSYAWFLLVCALVFGSLLCATPAQAYEYAKTYSEYAYNRCYIEVSENTHLLSLYGADPHSSTANMPSWDAPSGWPDRVEYYRFTLKLEDGDAVLNASCRPWNIDGIHSGHEGLDSSKTSELNGRGFGCLATYGYSYRNGKGLGAMYGSLDDKYLVNVHIKDKGPEKFYGWVQFWPRVTIAYNANGGTGAPASHKKYIGSKANISKQTPTRVGYTFEGWSFTKNGSVSIAPGQLLGTQDWNLSTAPYLPHSWNTNTGKPDSFYCDNRAGVPSPSGTNTITLYAVWKPIQYSVQYLGNGATSGTMLNSSHVYDQAKQLTANAYVNTRTLTCDARGGSAGIQKKSCNLPWRRWNTAAGGTGTSFTNRQSVKNLLSTSGVFKLYAQWGPGSVQLPSPGTYANHTFDGWYSAASGGARLGGAGDVITITKDTTVYAHWTELATVNYYVDGSSSPLFSEQVKKGSTYTTRATVKSQALKEGCNKVVGWFSDSMYKSFYTEGSKVTARTLNLYAYNALTVSYALTYHMQDLLDEQACYLDEALTQVASSRTLVPASKTLRWGALVSTPSLSSVWYSSYGAVREMPFWRQLYLGPEDDAKRVASVRLTRNTTLYLNWLSPDFDGIAVQ